MVVKEISRSVQEEFNDKLENISQILDDEKISNKEKIEEVREALDGIDMDIKNKMKETTDNLLNKIHEEVKQSGEGNGIDMEISVVKVGIIIDSQRENDFYSYSISRTCWTPSPVRCRK